MSRMVQLRVRWVFDPEQNENQRPEIIARTTVFHHQAERFDLPEFFHKRRLVTHKQDHFLPPPGQESRALA